MLKSSLQQLAAGTGQSLEYRNGVSGAWIALPDSFLEQGDPVIIDYDQNRRAVMAPAKATLRIAAGGPRLAAKPVAQGGSQVRHTLGSSITVYGIVGPSAGDAVGVYELQREAPIAVGDPHGGVPR